ncbi:WYL domain-containing protein [Streptomyces sp. Tu 3180]|uniref:helix-turn-helix transcriptional regulator n=1 Tax=Streptomyces sp. Tu 3180 TaxID=2682611 RepID=UPI001357F187|nr:WYL domain-containing protein [Streptomyces sp. Tu 3180]KAF3463929.1 WYL domain-containing protein [Streptomyces sp. Tu 3180]
MTPDRFFSLLLALQTREAVTAADLADRLGVSVRTVLRDLRWLQEAGFPVLVERGRWGGVTLLPGGALDTSRLTPAERDHLALHGLDDEQRHQLGAGAESRRARAKVAARPQPATSRLPISAVVTTDNRPWFGRDAEGADPSAVVGDVRRGVRLRIRYRRSEEVEPAWQVVDPYGLLAKAGRWYLVADRSGVPRLYALERLVDWRPMRAPRRLRPGTTLADVVTELTSRWETVDAVRVHARLAARQLDRAGRILGSRLTVRSREGEEVTITVACREIEDVRQLLPFADDLTVTDPPEARDRIRELAARILHRYAQDPSGRSGS